MSPVWTYVRRRFSRTATAVLCSPDVPRGPDRCDRYLNNTRPRLASWEAAACARHFHHYFTLLGLPVCVWSRRGRAPSPPDALASCRTVLLLIRDEAIVPFVDAWPAPRGHARCPGRHSVDRASDRPDDERGDHENGESACHTSFGVPRLAARRRPAPRTLQERRYRPPASFGTRTIIRLEKITEQRRTIRRQANCFEEGASGPDRRTPMRVGCRRTVGYQGRSGRPAGAQRYRPGRECRST